MSKNIGNTIYDRSINYYETDQMGIVHHSNYIDILRHTEKLIFIGEFYLFSPFIAFDKHHKLTKDFTKVSSIYFVNDKEIFAVRIRIFFRSFAEAIKHTGAQFKTIIVWLIAHYEVFIAIALMELNHFNVCVVFRSNN